MKKTVMALAVAAASVCSVAAQADVKVGFLGGFTGGIESLTPPIFDGAKLAVAEVNEQGGLLDGEKMVMPSGDTTCSDAAAASNAADRLVNSEKVTAIVGALCTGATIAAANNAAIPGGVCDGLSGLHRTGGDRSRRQRSGLPYRAFRCLPG